MTPVVPFQRCKIRPYSYVHLTWQTKKTKKQQQTAANLAHAFHMLWGNPVISFLPSHPSPQDLSKVELEDEFYDHFHLRLSSVQIIVAARSKNWNEARTQGQSPFHVLCPTELDLALHKSLPFISLLTSMTPILPHSRRSR